MLRTRPLLFGIIVKVATTCAPHTPLVVLQPWNFFKPMPWKQRSRLSSYFLLSQATFSCFHFTPGLAFGEKDISHPAITEYLSLTGQGKLRNRKIISERKQTFYGNSLPVRRTDRESIFVGLNIFLSANPTKPTLFRNSAQATLGTQDRGQRQTK